jgi:flagellar basal-body rod modification protein FlgD
MEISPTTYATNTSNATSEASDSTREEVSSDFETFLRMLTVQMQNQDPLNPVDSADYAIQLATFSGVEQQVKTNDLLTSLGQQMGLTGLSQLAGWVGMEARAAAPAFFDGSPITVYSDPPAIADALILVVRNAAGQEVFRSPVDPTAGTMQWDGSGVDGLPVPAGLYQFDVESYANESIIATETALVYTSVTEAKFDGGQMMVVLKSGAEIPASEVTAIRDPYV